MSKTILNKFVGDKKFYKKVLAVALPIMLQNGISNFVNMLDNLMVGRIGTEQMSGVSIMNDLMFVFTLCLFGVISGAGIFTAQFYGQKNYEGVKETFRIKVIICAVVTVLGIVIFSTCYSPLISMYLHEGSAEGDLVATFNYAADYMWIIMLSLPVLALEFCYSSTLRETGETVLPMKASIAAVFVNLVLNYLLIYGKFGLPILGVKGAAIATVISRIVQLLIEIIWVRCNLEKVPFMKGVYSSMRVSGKLIKNVIIMGLPLMINETLWSAGVVSQKQSYSLRGLAVVAGMNINSTMFNVFNIVFIALGDAVAIIVGHLLGAGKMKEAKDTSGKIIAFSTFVCVIMGTFVALTAGLYPMAYKTSEEVRSLAKSFIMVSAILMPINGMLHSLYFTIRSGGKTLVTFLFDSAFMWVFMVPCAFLLTRKTNLDIVTIFAICEGLNIIKVIIGIILFRSGIWMQNIVEATDR